MDVIPLKTNKIFTMLIVLCITSIVCATNAFADYTITVPQNVTLTSSANGTGTYSGTASVKIAGNIEDGEQLCVSAPSTLTMNNGYKNVDATVNTSSKTVWNKDEVTAGQVQNNYNISATLTPGTWTGTETFYVSVGKTYNITVGDNSVSLISSNEDISHLKFKSDDDTVASVDSTGHLVGNGTGTINIVKTVYDSAGSKILYTTTYTVNVKAAWLTVIYDANGSTFANGSKQNTVHYGEPTKVDEVKTSKTSNVSDDGTSYSGGYGNNQAVTNTISIPGAEQLTITITYATESTSFDWVCVYDKTVTPSTSNYASSISGKLGGSTKTTKTFNISGDTVQFFFKSDGSNDSYFGYYATIKGAGTTIPCIAGTYEEPTVIADGMRFEGWYTSPDCIDGNEFNLKNYSGEKTIITVYAKWKEDIIAKGITGGVSWKLYPNGLLNIYPTNGISGIMDNSVGYKSNSYSGFEWNQYSSSIRSVVVDKGVSTNQDVSLMFYGCINLKEMHLENLDTSNATKMNTMFYSCSSLTTLDLSNFDTSNVTSMGSMFGDCKSLITLNLSSFNTSNVTTMGSMFENCKSLITLNLSNFNTSNVTTMGSMFENCEALTSLDVRSFNTSKVGNFSDTFCYCSSLVSLDISTFDTSSATDMSRMFYECSKLNAIDLNNFNTSNVTTMSHMFKNCKSLTTLDLNSFDTSKVTKMNFMFDGCESLVTVDISSFDTSSVTDMKLMFNNCFKLDSLNVSNFDTSHVAYMNGMFSGCYSLTTLDVSNFNTSKVVEMSSMFDNMHSITTLDLSTFDTSSVRRMSGMFFRCLKLTTLDISNFNTTKVTDISHMFDDCESIKSIDISNFDTSNVKSAHEIRSVFGSCDNLTSVNINSTFATGSLPSTGFVEGLFYVTNNTPLTIIGDVSDALKSYDFAGDNRTVQFLKISKTANVSSDGTTYSGGYGNNQTITDTVTIPGAEQLTITITYATESTSYDWVCVYDNTVTPSVSNYSSSISGKLGGRTKTTKTFTISGDTVQFFFKSDSSNDSYFGYYAVVEKSTPTLSGTISKTANVSDDGTTYSGGYGNFQAITDTITIPGAEQLSVTITYQTESATYDWVCLYDKNLTPSESNYEDSISGKLGGDEKTTETFTIDGDTVQFFFRSDSSNDSYFGYYAIVHAITTTSESSDELSLSEADTFINSAAEIAEIEAVNEPEVLSEDIENPASDDSTDSIPFEIDESFDEGQDDSQMTNEVAGVDTDYSEVDSNTSADADSTDDGEGPDSTHEPSSDDLYYPDSAAA